MKRSFPLIYWDVLSFRWLALNGLYVLFCTLKRNAKMSLANLGKSKDSHFECRVLFNWSCAPDIGLRLRRVMRHVAFVLQKRGSGRPLSMSSNSRLALRVDSYPRVNRPNLLSVRIVAKPLADSYVAPTLLR
jgi:hypothetical protein